MINQFNFHVGVTSSNPARILKDEQGLFTMEGKGSGFTAIGASDVFQESILRMQGKSISFVLRLLG